MQKKPISSFNDLFFPLATKTVVVDFDYYFFNLIPVFRSKVSRYQFG